MASYQIPDYLKTYPRPVVHDKFFHFKFNRWNKILRDCEEKEFVNNLAIFWAYFTPKSVSIEKLEVAVQWSHWFYRFREASRSVEKSSALKCMFASGCINGMVAIINGREPGLDATDEWKKLYLLYSAVRTRIYQSSESEFHLRFQSAMENMLSGYISELDTTLFSSLQEWSQHQTKISAGRVLCRLVEWMHDFKTLGDILESPRMIEIEQCAGDVIAYQQDIFSFRRDYIAGKGNAAYNTAQIVMMWEGKELQDAINRTDQLATERLDRFKELRGDLVAEVKGDKTRRLEVTKYVEALERIVPANVHWGIGNRLFFPDTEMADEVAKTLVVNIPGI